MTMGMWSEIDGVGSPTDNRDERLARRIAELYASDEQFRAARPLDEISAAIQQPGMRLAQIVQTVLEGYADRPALGQRAREFVTDDATGHTTARLLPRFDTITYRELWTRAGAVASAWQHTPAQVGAGDFVAIMGFASTDYTTLDLACIRLGAVSVPLQTSAPVGQLVPIIAETGPRIWPPARTFSTAQSNPVLAGFPPQRLVVFDYEPRDDDQRDRFEAARRRLADADSPVVVETLSAVIDRAKALPPAPLFLPADGEDPLLTLFYTSGSTGSPKGAMYTEHKFSAPWLRPMEVPAISLNYMPMSHVYGRAWLMRLSPVAAPATSRPRVTCRRCSRNLALVRPTALNLVPRVCDMIFQRYQSVDRRPTDDADRRPAGSGNQASMCAMTSSVDACWLLVWQRSVVRGDAGIHRVVPGHPPDHRLRLDRSACHHRGQGHQRPPVIDYKLVDVPELGYFITDQPHPRGELLVKTT